MSHPGESPKLDKETIQRVMDIMDGKKEETKKERVFMGGEIVRVQRENSEAEYMDEGWMVFSRSQDKGYLVKKEDQNGQLQEKWVKAEDLMSWNK